MGFNWDKHYNYDREPPPQKPTLLERIEKLFERFGRGRLFWISFLVLSILLIGTTVLVSLRMDETAGLYVLVTIFGIGFILLGLVSIFFPTTMWNLQHFLSVRGGEPTDFYIWSSIISGVIFVFGAFIFVILVLSTI